ALAECVEHRIHALERDGPVLRIAAGEAHHCLVATPELLLELVKLGAVDRELEAGITVVEVHAGGGRVPWRVLVELHRDLLLRPVVDLPAALAELNGEGVVAVEILPAEIFVLNLRADAADRPARGRAAAKRLPNSCPAQNVRLRDGR